MILPILVCLVGGPLRLEAKWTAPDQLPFPRVHSLVAVDSGYYVGGLKGLSMGAPRKWKQIDERPVRQMVLAGESIWVLFGDGSIDKIEYRRERLVFDALAGAVKRPWGSCLGSEAGSVLIGGQGGWFVRDDSPSETYAKELDKQVVTTVCRYGGSTWLGTQRQGLFQYTNGTMKRFGFAAGLPDSWITAMVPWDKSLVVGVADGGLVRLEKGRISPLESPCKKVRHLAVYGGQLIVGGMEGCWIRTGDSWQQLSNEETTFLGVTGTRLTLGSPTGLTWWQK